MILHTEGTVGPMSHGSIELDIPAKYKLASYDIHVRDEQNPWTQPIIIGWCAWDSNKTEFTADGGVKISVGLNNWSGERPRFIQIVANVT